MRSTQVVDVDQLESVVVAAGDNSAQGTKEIERFKLVVDERKDAVLRGHFFFFFKMPSPSFLTNTTFLQELRDLTKFSLLILCVYCT